MTVSQGQLILKHPTDKIECGCRSPVPGCTGEFCSGNEQEGIHQPEGGV